MQNTRNVRFDDAKVVVDVESLHHVACIIHYVAASQLTMLRRGSSRGVCADGLDG
jgi:hypothetical protein